MAFSYRFAALIVLSNLSFADSPVGLTFSHHDWSLVCDNTRTCRAVGYSSRKDENSVSVLLVRKAGAETLVEGFTMLDAISREPILRINNRVIGKLEHTNSHQISAFSENQTSLLLRSLLQKSNIEFLSDGSRWHLSDNGAAAVLLKMDEFQGRIGTPGALVRKGKKSEATVYSQLQIPSITQAPLAKILPSDDQFIRMNREDLLAAIRDSVPTENECSGLLFDEKEKSDTSRLEVVRLTGTKMLFSCICRRDEKNEYYGYWVVNDSFPFEPTLITINGQYSRNKASLRSRHQGDCSGVNEWTWDGNRFVLTNSVAWEICRKIDRDEAWRLPTVITNVF